MIDKLVFVSLQEATTPRNGNCTANMWWVCCPQRGLAFFNTGRYLAPQCNANQHIAEAVRDKLWPGLEVHFIPAVFEGYKA